MSGRLQPWSVTIDLQPVLAGLAMVLAAALVWAAVVRLRRAAKRPQDKD